MDSKALAKVQSIALIAIIVMSAAAGSVAYMLLSGPAQSAESIRIGIIGDLDQIYGKATLRGATLAAEQINAEIEKLAAERKPMPAHTGLLLHRLANQIRTEP